MTAKADVEAVLGTANLSPELLPVVEPDAQGVMLLQPAYASGSELALGDLLSDTLFGEVIDIADLIPELISPAIGAAQPSVVETPEFSQGGDFPGATDYAAALTILYDDDILASGDAML